MPELFPDQIVPRITGSQTAFATGALVEGAAVLAAGLLLESGKTAPASLVVGSYMVAVAMMNERYSLAGSDTAAAETPGESSAAAGAARPRHRVMETVVAAGLLPLAAVGWRRSRRHQQQSWQDRR